MERLSLEVGAASGSWSSYPKVYAFGHRSVAGIFDEGEILVEEKIDGSQFSFGVINGELKCRTHHNDLILDAPEKLFSLAVTACKELIPLLHPDWTYRGEYLAKPKHNALAYDRTPNRNIILFDINTGPETYLPYEDVEEEAERIGLEVVPLLAKFQATSEVKYEDLIKLLETPSLLGGQTVEGIVCKNYLKFNLDGKCMMAKFVSEAFKEVHRKNWKEVNPEQQDIILRLVNMHKTPSRWQKSVQHLNEQGLLENDPKDIGPLIKEIMKDVQEECEDEIKNVLFKWAWSKMGRGITGGFPEWYKQRLLASVFADAPIIGEEEVK
jgi:hypothetical protein